jgi:hypothetical protein
MYDVQRLGAGLLLRAETKPQRFQAILAQVLDGPFEDSLNRVPTATDEGGDLSTGRMA